MARTDTELTPFLLGAFFGAVGLALARRLWTPAPPVPTPVGGPLDTVNAHFHGAYDDAKEDAALDAPVLVVLADSLICFRGKARHELSFTPPLFHVIKSVAHGPVALYAALHRLADGRIPAATSARLMALEQSLERAGKTLSAKVDAGAVRDNLQAILRASSEQVNRVLSESRVDAQHLERFARITGPWLLQATRDATNVQLEALDQHVAKLLAAMSESERRHFQVVVTGDHQARSRSLPMQYFAQLLGDAEADRRLTYGEGVTDEHEALALVGTRRLDRAIASAFFHDEHKLQGDVLGDAAHERLQSMRLSSRLTLNEGVGP